MALNALCCQIIILSIFIYNATCIKRGQFGTNGLEHKWNPFPETHEDKGTPIIPESWKTVDSSKFDRSIQLPNNAIKREEEKQQDNRDSGNTDGVCMTKECVTAAASIIQRMDESVDPCHDFYTFACGSFIDNEPIPEEASGVSTMSKMQDDVVFQLNKLLTLPPKGDGNITADEQMARDYHYSCRDERTLDELEYLPLIKVFKDLGLHVPMFRSVQPLLWRGSIDKPVTDILKIILTNFLADSGLFGLDLSPDSKNAKQKTLLMLYQPSTGLTAKQYTDESDNGIALRSVYAQLLVAIAKDVRDYLAKYDPLDDWPGDDLLLRRVQSYMDTEAAIASILQHDLSLEQSMFQIPLDEFKNLSKGDKIRNTMIWDSTITNNIDVMEIAEDVLTDLTGFQLESDDILNVPHVEYFQQLNSALRQIPEDDLINYLTFREFVNKIPATTSRIRDLFHQWDALLGGSKVSSPRWKTCVHSTKSKFSAKVSQLYTSAYHGTETKQQTKILIENLRESFRDVINATEWMDSDTKAYAVGKLQDMESHDGFPGELNANIVSEVYKGLVGIRNSTYLENIAIADRWWTKNYFSYLNSPPLMSADIYSIEFDTTVVNAMYNPQRNGIWIPLAIQKPPIYQEHSLSALTYGALGGVLGHELTHGFDSQGSLFDKSGNLEDWWKDGTYDNFKDKGQCFIDQYDKYTFDIFDRIPGYEGPRGVNGSTTLNENIADNGGIREAWGAYKKFSKKHEDESQMRLPGLAKYSPDQLFFVSFGNVWCESKTLEALAGQLSSDPHSPAPVRVKAVLSNMQEFQDAFKCKTGDKMVPEKRCIVW